MGKLNDLGWTKRPQECDWDYAFEGKVIETANLKYQLKREEIDEILYDLLNFVKEKGTVDYLQVYDHIDGRTVFIIDKYTKQQVADLPEEHQMYHVYTIMMAEDY